MIKLCQEAAAAQRMTFLFVFRKAGIFYVTSQVGRNRNKASALSTHFSVSPPFCFLPPLISSFHTSCFLALILSLFRFLSHEYFFSPSAVIYFVLLCVRARVCVCNGSIVPSAAKGITVVRLLTYELNSTKSMAGFKMT